MSKSFHNVSVQLDVKVNVLLGHENRFDNTSFFENRSPTILNGRQLLCSKKVGEKNTKFH